jgi:hypothetical protein
MMHYRRFRLLLLSAACLFALCLSLGRVRALGAERKAGEIQQEMTPEEFKAAGLNKLSPDELANLNNWLQGYRQKAEEKAASREKLQLIVSRIDGVLHGLKTGQIVTLEDGSSWKITTRDVHFYGTVDHPAAATYKTLFGWKIRIVAVGEYYVIPVGKQ